MTSFRRTSLILLLALLPILAASPAWAQEEAPKLKRKSLFLILRGNLLSMADDSFADDYGKERIVPEAKVALRVRGNIYIWGGFFWLSGSDEWNEWTQKSLVEPDIRWTRTLTKTNYALGLGYFAGLTDPGQIGIRLEVGFCSQSQNETSQEYLLTSGTEGERIEITDSAIGGLVDLGAMYSLKRWLFAELSAAFVYLPKKVDEETVNWGGFKIGVGLGLRF